MHAQCGGGENLKRLRKRVHALSQSREFSPWLGSFPEPWFFSDAENAAVRLEAAGFTEVETSVEPAAFSVTTGEEFKNYLRTFVLHRHLELLPDAKHVERYLEELTEQCSHDNPPWTLDYWRLNLNACKPLS